MKKNKITFAAATLILIFVAVMACMGKWQADNYESSILSIYAQQQDAYVQLVLDQINMLENRSDEKSFTRSWGLWTLLTGNTGLCPRSRPCYL